MHALHTAEPFIAYAGPAAIIAQHRSSVGVAVDEARAGGRIQSLADGAAARTTDKLKTRLALARVERRCLEQRATVGVVARATRAIGATWIRRASGGCE